MVRHGKETQNEFGHFGKITMSRDADKMAAE